ncbi:hypothetical protein ABGB18_48570 [Nonomuraea sp. B12E4]|uniref:hypothetical protein n=1 Tax=Nonomuraea sp. B12E4 TaxID=3153564 RepID=UPI00325E703B
MTVISAGGDQEAIEHHAQVAKLSTRGRHIVAPTTDHYPHLADPTPALREIRRILAQTREGEPGHDVGRIPGAVATR